MQRRTVLRAALAVPLLSTSIPTAPAATGPRPDLPIGGLTCELTGQAFTARTPAGVVPPAFSVPLAVPAERDAAEVVLTAAPAEVEILPGIATRVVAYDGMVPGPTIVARPGEEAVVRLRNRTEGEKVIHLHGAHTAAEHDGHPLDAIAPGEEVDYRYPNRQRPATMWYHDHAMMVTAANVHRGLAGFYLLRDPAEADLGLPVGGPLDLPLMLSDVTFDAAGQLVYPDGLRDGFLGDVPLVNGRPQPVGTVPAGLLRLRILNASNARPYRLQRSDGLPLVQIASDGGLLAEPVARDTIELWPAERVEVLLDLRTAAEGDQVALVDAAQFREGLVRFVVEGSAPDVTPPTSFAPLAVLGDPAVVRDVMMTFDAAAGMWLLNGAPFDAGVVDARPRLGEVERWRITNAAPGTHPVHLHQSSFLVHARRSANGAEVPLEAGDVGWKDTVVVRIGQTVEVDVRFDDFPGTFVYHCHILEHEDHAMMRQFRVIPSTRVAGASRVDTATAAARHGYPDGAPVVVVAAAGTFPDALAGGPVAARLGGPLLLTDGPGLGEALAQEIARLAPGRIVVAGGRMAVPAAVVQALESLAPTELIAGASREATAAALSRLAFERSETAWIATGADFPDALAAAAAAAAAGAPLLLVGDDRLPQATAEELDRLGVAEVRLVGGPAVIDAAVEQAIRARGIDVRRLAGADRFATAAAVAAETHPSTAPVVTLATGRSFADALAAAPLAARQGGPLLLVGDTLPPVTADAILRLRPERLIIMGGEAAVALGVEHAAAELIV